MTIPEISVIRHAPFKTFDIADHIDYKFYRLEDKVKWANTKSPAVRIGTCASKREVNIFIEVNGDIRGVITLESPEVNLFDLFEMVKNSERLFTPHTSFHKDLQGLGYAPAIYTAYLNKGASFVTHEQTTGAEKLWDKLASQGFKMIYVERYAVKGGGWANRIVDSNSNKKFTVKCLLGKGVKPENLFYLEASK